jgi:integrase
VKLHRVHHREINILAKPEICSLLEAAGGTDLYLPILVAVATGVRRVELLALRSSDIDFEAGNLTVRQSLERIG